MKKLITSNGGKKAERNSGFELLRILCIFGIIYMHSFGDMLGDVEGIGLVTAVFENALFNTGVSCFVLISGYFSVKFDAGRLMKLDMTVFFYSILGTAVALLYGDSLSISDWIQTFFPVIGKRYWFISCYFCMVILSPFLNRIPENLEKSEFQRLLVTCLFIFSIVPSVFFMVDNIMSDAGKGLANMILLYLTGRYIRFYVNEHYGRKKLLRTVLVGVFLTFALNMSLSVIRGTYTGNFARDCSVTVILSAVFIFLFFRELSFRSFVVNSIAGHVIAAYVFESVVRRILNYYIDLSIYMDEWYLFAAVTVYAFLVLCICITVDIVRMYTLGRIDGLLIRLMEKNIKIVLDKFRRYFENGD